MSRRPSCDTTQTAVRKTLLCRKFREGTRQHNSLKGVRYALKKSWSPGLKSQLGKGLRSHGLKARRKGHKVTSQVKTGPETRNSLRSSATSWSPGLRSQLFQGLWSQGLEVTILKVTRSQRSMVKYTQYGA